MKTLTMNVIITEAAVFLNVLLELYTLKNIIIAKIPLASAQFSVKYIALK